MRLSTYLPTFAFALLLVYVTAFHPYANWPPIRSDGSGYHVWTYGLKTLDFRFCEYAALGDAVPSAVPGRCVVKWPPGVALFRFPVMAWFVDAADHEKVGEGAQWVVLLFGAALTLGTYLLGLRVLVRLGIATLEAQAVLYLLFFGTGLFHYGTYDSSFSHIYSAFGSTILVWQITKLQQTGDTAMRAWDLVLAGLTAFFMILFRNTNAFILAFAVVLVALAPAVTRKKLFVLGSLALGGGIGVVIQLAYNSYVAGHFSTTSYLSESFVWDRPMAASVLVSFERGLFTYYPIVLAGLALGLARRASRAYTAGLAALVLAYATLYGYWHQWALGGGFGHRGFVEVVPWLLPVFGLALAGLQPLAQRRVLLAASLTLGVSLPVMLGYWNRSFPFDGADAATYWAHVIGRLSGTFVVLGGMIGLFLVTHAMTQRAGRPARTGATFTVPWLIVVPVFVLGIVLRVRGISDHFWLLRDQIRDWGVVLQPVQDLPLVGPATHVGGYTIGPAFYWLYWALRVTFGPWFENLPHAGGIGQAVLQSGVDALLVVAVWKRTKSVWPAMAAVVILATAPFDVALAPVLWNPVAGSILSRAATALILLDWQRGPLARTAVIVALAWCAVHAYTGAIFVAVTVFATLLIEPLLTREWQTAWRRAAVIVTVVAVLQIPYLAFRWLQGPDAPALAAVTDSFLAIANGQGTLRLVESAAFYSTAVTFIQALPWPVFVTTGLLVVSGVLVAVGYRREPTVIAILLLPQLAAIAGYAIWVGEYDYYYYLSLMPAAVLTVVLGATVLLPSRLAQAACVVLIVATAAALPDRIRTAATFFRMPEYRALVMGSREIAKRKLPMRDVTTSFPLPRFADSTFLFSVLGGRLDGRAEWRAEIQPDGHVTFSH